MILGVGTCRVKIVMLATFPPNSLPGEPSANPIKSDVATFKNIYGAAVEIFSTCVQNSRGQFRFKPAGGWSYTGT